MLNIILFGPPGSGKGTQAEMINQRYELIHLSTGDLLRSEIAAGTDLGLKAKENMDKGELVPDEVVIGMIEAKLESNPESKGFIFDGFPRTVPQAEALDMMLRDRNAPIVSVLYIQVSEEELTKRILLRGQTSGRSDDQDESVIRNRVSQYKQKTAPVAEYYRDQGKLQEVDGQLDVSGVFIQIAGELDALV